MSRFHPASPDYHRGVASKIVYDPATATMIGLSVVSAASQVSSAKKQAKATIAEGNIVAANKAKDIARKTATQRVSFLNSGLTLEGTPMNAIDSTFNTGLEDIAGISNAYNMQAKNQIAAGRSAAIGSLVGGLSSFAMPSIGSSATFGTNSFGGLNQAIGSGFNSTAIGPFQGVM